MPDEFLDDLVALALQIPGVWLAEDPENFGVTLSSSAPVRELVAELTAWYEEQRAWRVRDVAYPLGGATLHVVNEIDRVGTVHIRQARSTDAGGSSRT